MNNEQILEIAIQKAIDGGWLPYFAEFDKNMHKDNIVIRFSEGAASVNFDYVMAGHIVGVGGYNMEPYSIIFNYDFAKALWGEHRLYYRDIFPNDEWNASELLDKCAWHYHLQQMVIAEDPIKYLGENI